MQRQSVRCDTDADDAMPLHWRLTLQALTTGVELPEPEQRVSGRVHRAPQPCGN